MSDIIEEKIIEKILTKKIELESLGFRPRVILINNDIYEVLKKDWIKSIKELPWGDSLIYELEHNPNKKTNIFLADGSLFGLWIIKVDTIEEFEVR